MGQVHRPRKYLCVDCGAVTRVLANPYYGTGLAVHPYLGICDYCETVTFISAETAPDEDDLAASASNLYSRIRAAVARLVHPHPAA